MTVKELKVLLSNSDDNDMVVFCTCRDDNPLSDYCDVGDVYQVLDLKQDIAKICLMPV